MNPVAARIIILSKASIRTGRQRVMPVGEASLVRHPAQEIYVLLGDEEIHSVDRIRAGRIAVIVQNSHRSCRGAQTYSYRITQRHIESFSAFDNRIIDY